jgi:indole-3-glycerol phosphate synthase
LYLQDILDFKKIELAELKKRHSYLDFEKQNKTDRPKNLFREALKKSALTLIAEIKKASPSEGLICKDFEPIAIARTYADMGAHAISVVTDQKFFQGHMDFLKKIRDALPFSTPILRKDFILDEIQVLEAKAAGADACLLIVKALPPKRLCALIECSESLGLDALVEIHDQEELQIAIDSGAALLGVNNRNLQTFKIDLKTSLDLIPQIPKTCLRVSESGLENRAHIDQIRRAGADAVLIGTAFMKTANKKQLFQDLFL